MRDYVPAVTYFGLRSYLAPDDPQKALEIGGEPTPALYVAALLEVFGECWRVLRDDGCMWVNLGDSYAGSWGNYGGQNRGKGTQRTITNGSQAHQQSYEGLEGWKPATANVPGIKEKNLIGIPWRVAFALQDAGWYLRSEIIWEKPSCMPESVRDRPTRSHEQVFLLTKSPTYFYDQDAVREPQTGNTHSRGKGVTPKSAPAGSGIRANTSYDGAMSQYTVVPGGRNRRTVWRIASQPSSDSHYAMFPEALAEICLLAGTSPRACEHCGAPWARVVERTDEIDTAAKGSTFDKGKTGVNGQGRVQAGERYIKQTTGWAPTCRCVNAGTGRCVVLDPFSGSGTVSRVAIKHGRDAINCELNAAYLPLIDKRTDGVQTMMEVSA